MAKFDSKKDYEEWCESIITKIYYANIAMNDQGIRDAIKEIASTLHLSEGEYLFDGGDTESTDAE